MTVDYHELRVYDQQGEQLRAADNAGTITVDRGWSPHVQGRLTVHTPEIDFSTEPGRFLTIELTQRFGDVAFVRDLTERWCGPGRTLADLTAEVCGPGRTLADLTAELITAGSWNTPVIEATGRTLELVITSRTRNRDGHTLELASREVLFQSWLWYRVNVDYEGQPLTFEADTPFRFLRALLDAYADESDWLLIVGGMEDTFGTLIDRSTAVAISPTSHTIQSGEGTIAALQQLMTQTRQRLYSPGDGTVQMIDQPHDPAGSITVEHAVNLIDWEITDDRTVGTLVRFTGSATNPAARPVYSSFAFPDLNAPHERLIDAPHKPMLVTIGWSTSGIEASVGPYLARVGLDESPLKLRTINNYSVMPGSAITYALTTGDDVVDSIDAITWELGGSWESDIWV